MKQRDPLVATLLSLFVPFYILYWFYATAKDMRQRGGNPPSLWRLFAPLLGLVAMVVVSLAAPRGSSNSRGVSIVMILVGLVLVALSFVLPLMYYYRFSATAEKLTGGKVSKAVGFLLFLFVAPAAVYIIQDKLNETSGTLPTATPPPTNPVDGSVPPPVAPAPPNIPPTPTNPVL